jgi:hypothetical protein
MGAESRIAELKLVLPPRPKPMGAYRHVVIGVEMEVLFEAT